MSASRERDSVGNQLGLFIMFGIVLYATFVAVMTMGHMILPTPIGYTISGIIAVVATYYVAKYVFSAIEKQMI